MPKLFVNAIKVGTTQGQALLVGVQPYDQALLKDLRAAHHGDHLFKRGGQDGNSILSIPLRSSLKPVGSSTERVELADAPWLLAPLALEALTSFFGDMLARPLLKWRPLLVVSQRPVDFFPADSGLPDWLQRRAVLAFETRLVRHRNRWSSVVLVCGVRTRNVVRANCAEIIAAGLPLVGVYVGTPQESEDKRIQGPLKLVGRVKEIRAGDLILEDYGDGPNAVPAANAYLEPRHENLVSCVRHLLGGRADSVLAAADAAASKFLSGPERLELVMKTFDYIRSRGLELAPGFPFQLGPMTNSEQQDWPFTWELIPKPRLVFDPSGTKTDIWNERGIDRNGPFDARTFTPKKLNIAVICQQALEGQVDNFVAKFLDGLPDVKAGFGDRARAPYAKGFIRRYALEAPRLQTFTASGQSAGNYATACRKAVAAATDGGFDWNLAIVQIDQDFRELPDANNPYFATKAILLKHRIPVQEVTLETMRFDEQQLVFALNNMSVATYAKVGGIPWLLSSQPRVAHELVIGIGSHTHTISRLGAQDKVVGITTVFSSDGKYLLDDRTAAVPYGEYKGALYSSLKRSIESVRTTDNWRSTDAVRLIFHVFKEVANDEAEAVTELVKGLGLSDVKYAFVHLVDAHPFTVFDASNIGVKQRDGVKGAHAPERGVSVRISESETLMTFTGAREIKQVRHGMPQPVLLRLHRLSTFRDMTYLTRQAFDFSAHSWRMFTPEPLPITIHYSSLIAKLLAGLQGAPDWDPDTMLGPVSRTRWFL